MPLRTFPFSIQIYKPIFHQFGRDWPASCTKTYSIFLIYKATDCWHPIAYQIILILFIQTIVVNIKATCQILNTFIEIADQECLGNTITSF